MVGALKIVKRIPRRRGLGVCFDVMEKGLDQRSEVCTGCARVQGLIPMVGKFRGLIEMKASTKSMGQNSRSGVFWYTLTRMLQKISDFVRSFLSLVLQRHCSGDIGLLSCYLQVRCVAIWRLEV